MHVNKKITSNKNKTILVCMLNINMAERSDNTETLLENDPVQHPDIIKAAADQLGP